MYRHIFIIPIKENTTDELLEIKMQQMRDMKLSVSEIEDIHVNRTLGWVGSADNVMMTIDVKDKKAFDALLKSEAHSDVAEKADEAFIPSGAVAAQIEL